MTQAIASEGPVPWRLALVVGCLAAIFIIDLLTPRGIVDGALYVLPIWYARRLAWRYGIVVIAAVATSLVILGYFTSPEGVDVFTSVINRGLAIAVIWAMAGALLLNRVHRASLNQANAILKQRSGELNEAMGLLEEQLKAVREIEAALRASERRFRRLFDANMIALAFWSADGTIRDANDAWLSITGYTREDLVAGDINWEKATPPEYAELDRKAAEELSATGSCSPFEKEYVSKDGARVPVLVGAATIGGPASEAVTYVVDLSRIRALEEQIRQGQKMEAVGQLAGGIAHDFNNLLTVILGNLQLLEGMLKDQPEASELLQEASKASWRGAELCKRILAFSRRQNLSPESISVNDLVEGMETLLRRTLGQDVAVEFDLGSDLAAIVVDPGQLENAILNLALNSHDAMSEGGTLSVRTVAFATDEHYLVRHPDVPAGQYIVVEVSDTGKGMTPDVVARVFEPFFTTKEIGRGSGLGLSMVYGFLKQSDGHARVYSEPGVGTSVRLYFPATPALTATRRLQLQLPVPPEEAPGGSERILVVEDDAEVRATVTAMLSNLGYAVSEANSGAAGLEVLLREGKNVDLLVSDVVMPGGIDGYELSKRARALFPDLKVVLISGFARGHTRNGQVPVAGAMFLNKPFRKNELARVLRQVLDA